MDKKNYIMWSDGVLTSFGLLLGKNDCGSYEVKNPVSIAFAVVNEPVLDEQGQIRVDENGQPIVKGGLKWEMNPYVFGACLKDSADNIWTVNPHYVITEDAEYDERLISHYETLVKLCDKVQG